MLMEDNSRIGAYGSGTNSSLLGIVGENGIIVDVNTGLGGIEVPDGKKLYITSVHAGANTSGLIGSLRDAGTGVSTAQDTAVPYIWGANIVEAGGADRTVPATMLTGLNSSDYWHMGTEAKMRNVNVLTLDGSQSAFITYDGEVWSGGSNSNGQRGDNFPLGQIKDATRVTRTGNEDSDIYTMLTRNEDGEEVETLFVTLEEGESIEITGMNYYDDEGFNTYQLSRNPVRKAITEMTGFRSGDERVVTWQNQGGKLYLVANEDRIYGRTTVTAYDAAGHMTQIAVTVKGKETVAAPMVSSGQDYSLALKADGTLWAWGNNYYGQLATGTDFESSATSGRTGGRGMEQSDRYENSIYYAYPNQVLKGDGTPLENIVSISAGKQFALAVDADGQVWLLGDAHSWITWHGTSPGRYSVWHIGYYNYARQWTVPAGKKAVAASAGDHAGMILMKDGTVYYMYYKLLNENHNFTTDEGYSGWYQVGAPLNGTSEDCGYRCQRHL